MDKGTKQSQVKMDFEVIRWPSHEKFPLNRPPAYTIDTIFKGDILDSKHYLIVTGFTSLSHLIDTFGSHDHDKLKSLRILIGWEPQNIGRKQYERLYLPAEVKDYWLTEGLSIMQGGAVMALIEKIKTKQIEFKFLSKLHAKLYVGDSHAVLGSANFSKRGLNEQQEANIRVGKKNQKEDTFYDDIKLIAESYYEDAFPYNEKISELLMQLIKQVHWKEALARAVVEMLEGNWLDDYKNIIAQLEQTKLWPTQVKGIAQGVSILQQQSSVLIADPTGAGKTKLCAALILSLQHWLFEIGKYHKTESLIVCPPLVVPKWSNEFQSFRKISHQPRSMGLLSTKTGKKRDELVKMLNYSNILTIDEAHNYLSPDSDRTNLIKDNNADYRILLTATPISKKVQDLLRLIELLDVDNLSDEDFITYKQLLGRKREITNDDMQMLRNFISKFTVRRTKKYLNAEIDKSPDSYKNRLGKKSRFPKQNEQIYETEETEADKEIVRKIDVLAADIKGIMHLIDFRLKNPDQYSDDGLELYVQRRINSGRALAIYQIRAALRSSSAALVEHIEGTKAAESHFDFKGKTNESGNKLEKIERVLTKGKIPPKSARLKPEYFPEWLLKEELYTQACQEEIKIYKSISNLAKRLSQAREIGKVNDLAKAAKKHKCMLAFDSTVITLYYLRKLINERHPNLNILLATGSEKEKDSQLVLNKFNLESKDTDQCLALCSDKMSESVDLQKGSCLFLLDLPSVVRIVEQRIGRVDRMDSLHEGIDLYWPKDSEEFSLKADYKLIETNDRIEQIFGSNFNVPQELRGRRFKNVDSIESIKDEFRDFMDKDESWAGIQDSFQCIVDLKEGPSAIIPEQIYNEYKDVRAEVRTRVSFLSSSKNWCFIALKGQGKKSPRWFFIEEKGNIYHDNEKVCEQLRAHVKENPQNITWSQETLDEFVEILKQRERELLPPKKQRALKVALVILSKKFHSASDETRTPYKRMIDILKSESNEVIDYERLAEEWIHILQPLMKARRSKTKKYDAVNYDSLKNDHKQLDLSGDLIAKIIDHSLIAEAIDKRIAACIIGVKDPNPIVVHFEEVKAD